MITDRKITLYGISSFYFYCWNQFKVIPLVSTLRTVHSLQVTSNFLRHLTQVDNTADNADITQSQAANHSRTNSPSSSHVTLGLIECKK